MDHISSHSSHSGPINFISRPDCCICKEASVDTHIELLMRLMFPGSNLQLLCVTLKRVKMGGNVSDFVMLKLKRNF